MYESYTLLNGLNHHKELEHSSRRELIDIVRALQADIDDADTNGLEWDVIDLRSKLNETEEENTKLKGLINNLLIGLDIGEERL